MRRRIGAAVLLAALAGALILLWRLDIPHWKKLDLDKLHGAASATVVYDANGDRAGTIHGAENREWVSIDEVPTAVQRAFIAAEDLRFYRHHGVDVKRMLGALWRDITTLSYAEGASTITQQLIKLTHLSSEKRLSRKAQEIFLALQLERVLDKRQILEAYLNTIYFGHGAYGIESAARTYFDKRAAQLSLAEGALLAGVIKAPSRYAPHLNPDRAIARRNGILDTMASHGLVEKEEAERARGEALRLAIVPEAERQYAWYMDEVLREAATLTGLSADEIVTGGYRIDTGLDPSMQSSADALYLNETSFPPNAADGTPVEACLIAIDAATGEVRAVNGGRRYSVEMGLDRATQARRQPGSAFKPVSTYAAAIDAYGFLPSSTVEDTPRTFDGGYAPRNAGGQSYGTVTLREALSRSLNIATVDLADLIGTDALREYAARFGIPLSKDDVNLSLALGSLTDGVSPADLGSAYCALVNGGIRVAAHFIRSIRDADGRLIYAAPAPARRAVSEATACMLTDMLRTAATSGSARALSACGFPVAGKTGTVSEASGGTRDIWTVACTPELVTAVWMGFDRPDAGHAMSGSEGGGGYPARLCAAFYKDIAGQLSRRTFPRPASVKAALVDSVALQEDHAVLLATERTPRDRTVEELFHADDLPQAFSANWTAPRTVSDFRLESAPGQPPVLAFTAMDGHAEYQLLRTVEGETREVTVLQGAKGQALRYEDRDHDPSLPADYALIPRNALLSALGQVLTGAQPPTVHYAPDSLLDKLFPRPIGTDPPVEVEDGDLAPLFD